MANIFTNAIYNAGDWLARTMAGYIQDALAADYGVLGRYYTGDHRRQIKIKPGAITDDNVVQNFVGLAVDRSVSRLWRGGATFNLPEGAEAQQEYIDKVWDLNKKEIVLYQLALHGAVYGTFYFKVSPDALIDPYTGQAYPRLISVDPEIIRIHTAPQDMNDVEEYVIEYTCMEHRGERDIDVSHREITKHARETQYGDQARPSGEMQTDTWVVESWEQVGGAPWELVASVPWPYTFPPIIHGKNLPSLKSCYGSSDIDDAVNIQDKSNFVVSNTSKIIKHHASQRPIGTGFSGKDLAPIDDSPDSMMVVSNPEAKIYLLNGQSDLGSSRAFALDLRQSIFDISREVDISSMSDKLGALTNFGLQVLWSDAIDKNDTKRQLYGDVLLELNRRLLVLAGWIGPASQPGVVAWGDPLPVNVVEEMTADKMALELGIVDKGTVAERYKARYGKTWDEIQAAIAEESAASNAANADIGAQILRNFNRGEGVPVTPPNGKQPQGQ